MDSSASYCTTYLEIVELYFESKTMINRVTFGKPLLATRWQFGDDQYLFKYFMKLVFYFQLVDKYKDRPTYEHVDRFTVIFRAVFQSRISRDYRENRIKRVKCKVPTRRDSLPERVE